LHRAGGLEGRGGAVVNVEFNLAEYRSSVRHVLEAPGFEVKAIPGKRFRLDGSFNTTWFTTDRSKVVWLAMTDKAYPQRIMFAMLQELQDEVNGGAYGDQLALGGEDEFTKKIKPALKKYAAEYQDPAKDDLTRVMVKVDKVKITMRDNVDIVLKNLATSEKIMEDSARLQGHAKLFDRKGQTLKRSERWNNFKMNAIIAAASAALLGKHAARYILCLFCAGLIMVVCFGIGGWLFTHSAVSLSNVTTVSDHAKNKTTNSSDDGMHHSGVGIGFLSVGCFIFLFLCAFPALYCALKCKSARRSSTAVHLRASSGGFHVQARLNMPRSGAYVPPLQSVV
jgi:hypothetical protein